MHTMLGASLGDPLRDFNVDELEIFNFLDLVSGPQQIDGDVGDDNHFLELLLILIIHGVVKPGPIFLTRQLRVGPQVLNSLSWSLCLKL